MNFKISRIFLLALCGALAAHAAEPAREQTAAAPKSRITAAEAKYIKNRDELCSQIARHTNDVQGIAALEQPLRSIIGPVKTDGIQGQGVLTLYPLFEESPCDYLDGITFPESNGIFVTTPGLLENYLARHRQLPRTLSELSKTPAFYMLAFRMEGKLASYAEIPVRTAQGQDYAYAFLSGLDMESEETIAVRTAVLVSTGGRVFIMFTESPETKVPMIPECMNEWDSYAAKRGKTPKDHRASRNEDSESPEEYGSLEEKGFAAYFSCYMKNSKDRTLFDSLAQDAQSTVNSLH